MSSLPSPIPRIFNIVFPSLEPAAMAEGGANSPVATTGAGDGQESTTASVKPKRTRGKSTGAKPRGKASVHAEAL